MDFGGNTSDVRCGIDDDKNGLVALLDFSKAFDTVNHKILIEKLTNQFGLETTASKLIASYIQGHLQVVYLPVYLGAPQGSVLGPLLIVIFINNVSKSIKNCYHHIYADDLQIYKLFEKCDASKAVAGNLCEDS